MAALSARTARVRLQMYSLFLTTRSVGCVKDNRGLPQALIVSDWSPASTVILICECSCFAASLNSGLRSTAAFVEPTAIMQSPRFVRKVSLVISNVVLLVDCMFSCPCAWMSSVIVMFVTYRVHSRTSIASTLPSPSKSKPWMMVAKLSVPLNLSRVSFQNFVRASTQAFVPMALLPAITMIRLFLFHGFGIFAIRPMLSLV